jgi:hypothetical protein
VQVHVNVNVDDNVNVSGDVLVNVDVDGFLEPIKGSESHF